MAPDVSDLPTEVIEGIVCSLELIDLCNFRATGKSIAAKASQGRFKTYFLDKTVGITEPRLAAFARITQHAGLGCLVEHVRVAGNLSDPAMKGSEPYAQHATEIETLAEAFRNLKVDSKRRQLRSLALGLMDYDDDNGNDNTPLSTPITWRNRFLAAAKTFKVALAAIQESGLPVESLNLFGEDPCCSVACDHMSSIQDFARHSEYLKPVKRLTLSLSHSLRPDLGDQVDEAVESSEEAVAEAFATVKPRIAALSNFLGLMPALEELELHWYKLSLNRQTAIDVQEQHFFDHVCKSIPTRTLTSCTLRGLYTSEASLFRFLSDTSARRITLQEIHLHQGTFGPILECLTRHEKPFEYFNLDDMFESSGRLVYFKIPGLPKFSSKGGTVGPSSVEREGKEVQEPLQYAFARGRAQGTTQFKRWSERRADMFGPPERIF